jgi:acetyltransferase-like isoleucine patch superfamily enzyme
MPPRCSIYLGSSRVIQTHQIDGVQIHPTAEIEVEDLQIGLGSIIGPYVRIEGHSVHIGREAWLDRYAYIGGGSSFDPVSTLVVGDWLHMGRNSHINTARPTTIGSEFGCGIETKVFAHGAYLSELDGFPVHFEGCTIGDRVWLPNAWVNPGVTIGSDVVVAARSLVNTDIPSGCLAGGIPARIIHHNYYPQKLPLLVRVDMLEGILVETAARVEPPINMISIQDDRLRIVLRERGESVVEVFDFDAHTIAGNATAFGYALKDQLRRHGIRFPYTVVDGQWRSWAEAGI